MIDADRDESLDSVIELEELLERYQCGDSDAARALVVSFSPALVRFCILAGDPPDQLEDVVQEIWMRVHQARRTYRRGAPAKPWLFAIARHARLDAFRRRRRMAIREVASDPLPDVGAAPEYDQPRCTLDDLLVTLPDSQRETLVMLKGLGMSLEEVARATSTTVGAVKQRASRAYQRLRLILSEKGAQSDT